MRYPQAPFRLNPPKAPKAPKAPKGAPKGRKEKPAPTAVDYPPVPLADDAPGGYPPVPASAWGPAAYTHLVGPRPAMASPEPPAPTSSSGIDFMWGTPGTWEYLHRVFVAHVLHAMYKHTRSNAEVMRDVNARAATFDRASDAHFGGRRPTIEENQAVSKQLKDLGILDVATESLPKFPPKPVASGRNNFFSQQARDTRASEKLLQHAQQLAEAAEPGVRHIRYQSGTRQYSPTLLRFYDALKSGRIPH